MKTHFLIPALLGVALLQVHAQAPTDDASTSATSASTETAIAAKGDQLFLIQNNQALRLEKDSLPEGQMLNADGVLVPLPADVTGFDASGETAAPATSATAATVDPAKTGITMRGGALFLVRNGQARPIDVQSLGDSLMMSLDGRQVPIPDNIDLNAAGSIKPGSIKPGKVTPGRVEGSSIKGPDIKGPDVQGSNVRGADVRGADVKGPDVSR